MNICYSIAKSCQIKNYCFIFCQNYLNCNFHQLLLIKTLAKLRLKLIKKSPTEKNFLAEMG